MLRPLWPASCYGSVTACKAGYWGGETVFPKKHDAKITQNKKEVVRGRYPHSHLVCG